MKALHLSTLVVLVAWLGVAPPAAASAAEAAERQADQRVTSGTIVSSSPVTLMIRVSEDEFQLFTFDEAIVKPTRLPAGAVVRVTSRAGDTDDVRVATRIVVERDAPAEAAASDDAVPATVRKLERDIARQVRRFGGGIRGGVGLDPELLSVGVHARVGPFFQDDVWFRPNLEFAYGEVTTMVALHLEGVYTLPIVSADSRWSPYVGAGPALTFSRRSFEDEDEDVDVSDFDLDAGFNILAGIEHRSGLFLELKGTAYAVPVVRMLVGFSF